MDEGWLLVAKGCVKDGKRYHPSRITFSRCNIYDEVKDGKGVKGWVLYTCIYITHG